MIPFTLNKSINFILQSLQEQSLSGPRIVEEVRKFRPHITKQAVYTTLRQLLHKEIVQKVHGVYFINRLWAKQLLTFAQSQLLDQQIPGVVSFENLSDGDKIIYQFKNPHVMDVYWGHIFDSMIEKQNQNIPLIIYHPHEWFIYSRRETEELFLNTLLSHDSLVFFAIGGDTPLDFSFKRTWETEELQISCGEKYDFLDDHYINILGDFIIEVFVDQRFGREIDQIFKTGEKLSFLADIEALSQKKYKTKMIISRNKKNAERIRKKIAKDFYLSNGFSLETD